MRTLYLIKGSHEEEISAADKLLNIFFADFEDIYNQAGQNLHTMTWHLIEEHLIEDVKRHGSLVFHSMFSSESFLGYIKKKLHGNRSLGLQFMQSKLYIFYTYSKVQF